MNPLDRINQLNNEVALLRSQLSDARKQLEADSATIAKLAKDKQELVSALILAEAMIVDLEASASFKSLPASYHMEGLDEIRSVIAKINNSTQ